MCFRAPSVEDCWKQVALLHATLDACLHECANYALTYHASVHNFSTQISDHMLLKTKHGAVLLPPQGLNKTYSTRNLLSQQDLAQIEQN